MEITPNMTPEQYVDQLVQEDEALRNIREAIVKEGMPEVSVAHPYGKLLTFLIEVSGAQQVLEIGALGGYSGLCLARGLGEKGRIVSLELKEAYAALAHQHLKNNGYGDRVEYRIGPAVDSLKKLQEEGKTFDFFFIDADKENYPVYLEYAIALANPGAIIAGDNCFLRGRTLNTDKNGPAVQAVRRFNETIATDPRLVSTLLPAYDGLALARVK
ncbi:putative O-methyltransferase YrrM [Paenibacillus jamilae]|uniref:O-methyltransferase n=1 Tax=Paenibacillus TaxID=44249 RepID=UPI0002F43147|nr:MULTISPECIES: O-methyltransferase [Paenibacillus]MDP9676736.1 putative O-methyltransferase YrrM [Paenibacillus jamilae]KAF6619068.1 O-methyltransferase [Paenibacillus sp. EKM101P]KAF6624159.1 O-methyltransferase [Paenibacillus sp. EKM102P]KAF6636067.1 O-methyltransferase [Paenibacillus sp. EKM10P]KAF6648230.1 O-methyltransferase [Paenibacillus sp. EKM11P]